MIITIIVGSIIFPLLHVILINVSCVILPVYVPAIVCDCFKELSTVFLRVVVSLLFFLLVLFLWAF